MMIHELAQKFLAQGYNIFGGYVRDLISGDDPKDIDVMMKKENFFLFIKAFLPEWDVVMYHPDSGSEPGNFSYDGIYTKIDVIRTKFVYRKTGDVVLVDVVFTDEITLASMPDLDVNKLQMNVQGITVMGGTADTISSIITRINNKRMVRVGDPKPERIAKMIKKGYAL